MTGDSHHTSNEERRPNGCLSESHWMRVVEGVEKGGGDRRCTKIQEGDHCEGHQHGALGGLLMGVAHLTGGNARVVRSVTSAGDIELCPRTLAADSLELL